MRALFVLLLVCVYIGYSQAKFCWSCTGFEGSACDRTVFNPDDPRVGKIECPRFCLKRYTFDDERRKITVRGCGGDDCVDNCESDDECTYCCQMKELCNGAGALTFNLMLTVGAAILAIWAMSELLDLGMNFRIV